MRLSLPIYKACRKCPQNSFSTPHHLARDTIKILQKAGEKMKTQHSSVLINRIKETKMLVVVKQ